jgi:flagellar protein FliO/FliZ
VIAALRAGAARLPRPAGTLVALAVVAAALPLAGGDLAQTAARAAIGAAAIGAALLAVRRRRGARAGAAPAPEIAVVARAALGQNASLALVEVAGRRVLVGFGGGAVSLVAELTGPGSEGRPT